MQLNGRLIRVPDASLLAGIGILLATRHYVHNLFPQTAILRTLGMTRRPGTSVPKLPGLVSLAGTGVDLTSGYQPSLPPMVSA